MKKNIIILLSVIFLFSNMGISINIDYCPMRGDYTISLIQTKACCCVKTDGSDCCKSKHVVLEKITDGYVSSSTYEVSFHLEPVTYECYSCILQGISPVIAEGNSNQYHAPPECSVKRNILYSTFLI